MYQAADPDVCRQIVDDRRAELLRAARLARIARAARADRRRHRRRR